jgi:hypothetical protein
MITSGTITVTNGSQIVNASADADWSGLIDPSLCNPPQVLKLTGADDVYYVVGIDIPNKTVTIAPPFAGASQSGAAYLIDTASDTYHDLARNRYLASDWKTTATNRVAGHLDRFKALASVLNPDGTGNIPTTADTFNSALSACLSLPDVTVPAHSVDLVADYGADSTGINDCTAEIYDAANYLSSTYGGGTIVFQNGGTFKIQAVFSDYSFYYGDYDSTPSLFTRRCAVRLPSNIELYAVGAVINFTGNYSTSTGSDGAVFLVQGSSGAPFSNVIVTGGTWDGHRPYTPLDPIRVTERNIGLFHAAGYGSGILFRPEMVKNFSSPAILVTGNDKNNRIINVQVVGLQEQNNSCQYTDYSQNGGVNRRATGGVYQSQHGAAFDDGGVGLVYVDGAVVRGSKMAHSQADAMFNYGNNNVAFFGTVMKDSKMGAYFPNHCTNTFAIDCVIYCDELDTSDVLEAGWTTRTDFARGSRGVSIDNHVDLSMFCGNVVYSYGRDGFWASGTNRVIAGGNVFALNGRKVKTKIDNCYKASVGGVHGTFPAYWPTSELPWQETDAAGRYLYPSNVNIRIGYPDADPVAQYPRTQRTYMWDNYCIVDSDIANAVLEHDTDGNSLAYTHVYGTGLLDVANRRRANATAGYTVGNTAYTLDQAVGDNLSDGVALAAVTATPTADTTAPTITSFSIPTTASELTVAITTLTATDDVGVAGWIPTIDDATVPAASDSRKVTVKPTTIPFPSANAHTARMYAVDAAGNVSAAATATVTITLTANQPPSFTAQPSVQSATTDGGVIAYGTADADGDHYRLDLSTDNGATWTTAIADETPGPGKTVTVTALAAGTYTVKLRLTALAGDTTPVLSNAVQLTVASVVSAKPVLALQTSRGIVQVNETPGGALKVQTTAGLVEIALVDAPTPVAVMTSIGVKYLQ